MPPSYDPLHLPRAPSPDVLTTTVFAGGAPTATQSAPPSSAAPLPIGAIVGGLIAGVVLALAAVGGWIWWGRSLEKQKRKKQPRTRSAMKRGGNGSQSANTSKHSLPRTRPTTNPMATVSQKSVTFAPSPRTSEDSDPPKTPSPTAEPDVQNAGKGKQTPRAPPPRSTLRPPPGPRIQSAERAYAPARPSPLAHASHPPPATRPPNVRPAYQPEALAPPPAHPLPPARQMTHVSADRSSGVSSAVSAPSEYSQDGTASEGGDPFYKTGHAHGVAEGRLYAHQESEELEPSTSRSPSRQRAPPATTRIR